MKKSLFKAVAAVTLALVMVMLAVVPALAFDPMPTDSELCADIIMKYLGSEFSAITVNFTPEQLGSEDWWVLRAEDPEACYPSALDELPIGVYLYTAPCLYGSGKVSRLATYAVNLKKEIVYPLETALNLGYLDNDEFFRLCEGRRDLAFWVELLGDVDKNNKVNVVDATIIQKVSAGYKKTDAYYDVNSDNSIDVTDATQVQKLSAGYELPMSDDEVMLRGSQAMMDFAVRLLKASDTEGKNVLLSPLSVMFALAMAENGANGETLSQMENVLGMSRDTMNRYFTEYAKCISAAEDDTLSIANSIWSNTLRPDVAISEGYLNNLSQTYSAEVKSAPFDLDTLNDINGWVSDKTGGMIPRVLDDIDPKALLYLINALYFEALWDKPYEHAYTKSFTNFDGTQIDTDFLCGSEYTYIEGCGIGFIKPFRSEKTGRSDYAFVAMLPTGYDSLEDYIDRLSGDKLAVALRDADHTKVNTIMPKFKLEYDDELSDVLGSLGMTDAFDGEKADFSLMVTPDSMSSPFISRVIHKTAIEVDEFGTKAGAATVIEVKDSTSFDEEPPKKVYLQQPFLYMLIDTRSNTPIFIGTVNQL